MTLEENLTQRSSLCIFQICTTLNEDFEHLLITPFWLHLLIVSQHLKNEYLPYQSLSNSGSVVKLLAWINLESIEAVWMNWWIRSKSAQKTKFKIKIATAIYCSYHSEGKEKWRNKNSRPRFNLETNIWKRISCFWCQVTDAKDMQPKLQTAFLYFAEAKLSKSKKSFSIKRKKTALFKKEKVLWPKNRESSGEKSDSTFEKSEEIRRERKGKLDEEMRKKISEAKAEGDYCRLCKVCSPTPTLCIHSDRPVHPYINDDQYAKICLRYTIEQSYVMAKERRAASLVWTTTKMPITSASHRQHNKSFAHRKERAVGSLTCE